MKPARRISYVIRIFLILISLLIQSLLFREHLQLLSLVTLLSIVSAILHHLQNSNCRVQTILKLILALLVF